MALHIKNAHAHDYTNIVSQIRQLNKDPVNRRTSKESVSRRTSKESVNRRTGKEQRTKNKEQTDKLNIMATIEVSNLDLIFGGRKKQALEMVKQGLSKDEILRKTKSTVGVSNASFNVEQGKVFVIMGLSGSGKSSLLRCINRLNNPTEGKILVNGKDVTKMNEKELMKIRQKEISMVFQHFGLLPHRTVISNVAFGMELQGVDKEEREKSAMEAIKTVGLEGYEYKMTSELSGGMQQRVGLARALATDSEILLMDEAFSALDPLIRNQMQDELLSIQEKVKKTIVFITHDLDEALKLGDQIAIMKEGYIVQIGTPEEILVNPADDYVRAFVENVDRSDFVTAGSILFNYSELVHLEKDGPAVALRRMRAKGLNGLPVVDNGSKFRGFVMDDDVLELKNNNEKSVKNAIKEDFPTVLPETSVADIIPLFIDHNLPVAVVDENNVFKGLVVHSSVISEIIRKEEKEVIEIKNQGGNAS